MYSIIAIVFSFVQNVPVLRFHNVAFLLNMFNNVNNWTLHWRFRQPGKHFRLTNECSQKQPLPLIFFSKDSSQAYILMSLMAVSTSLVVLTRASVHPIDFALLHWSTKSKINCKKVYCRHSYSMFFTATNSIDINPWWLWSWAFSR